MLLLKFLFSMWLPRQKESKILIKKKNETTMSYEFYKQKKIISYEQKHLCQDI